MEHPASAQPRHPVVGTLAMLAGLGIALAVHLQPDKLRAPAWVAYAAALAFFFAGVSLLAQAWGASRRLLAWTGVVLVACLLTPLLWIAVTNPQGRCRANFFGLSMPAPEWICRGGLAFFAVTGLLILVLAVRQALRPPPSP